MTRRAFIGGDLVVEGELQRADLIVEKGRIAAVLSDATGADVVESIDCRGTIVAPGYIDLQLNGAAGFDLTTEPDRILDVARALPSVGTTAFLPTVVTSPESNRRAALAAMATIRASTRRTGDGAVPLGLHFEGPAISMDHLGAHAGRHVTVPSATELAEWTSDLVALVTLAPEVDGTRRMIETLIAAGVVVSAGHTAMSPEDLAGARAAGASYVTHLFNAMRPFSHRAPGPIGATLADDGVIAGLICDGIHVDPVAVRMAWRALGPSQVSLVSDAVAPLGMPFGTYRIGSHDVVYDETGVRTSNGTLAGSALALDQAVRNLVAFTGCDLLEAIGTVTTTPADLLGLTDRGRIRVGDHADLTIVDPAGELVATVIAGLTEWDASTSPTRSF